MATKVLQRYSPRWLTTTALFMAMNVALCFFSVPVPGGHFYLNDVVICTAAILLDPLAAFVVGGVGALLGDLLSGYAQAMLVSLAAHGLQALVISLCVRRLPFSKEHVRAIIGVILGMIIMVSLYTAGRAFVYATPEYAVIKLPYEVLQAGVGAFAGPMLCYGARLQIVFEKKILKS